MSPMFLALNILSVPILWLVFEKSRVNGKEQHDIEEKHRIQSEAYEQLKKDAIFQGKWNQEGEQILNRWYAACTREAFKFWFSGKSFQWATFFGLITLLLKMSAIPGIIFGLVFSSPRMIAYGIRGLHFFRRALPGST